MSMYLKDGEKFGNWVEWTGGSCPIPVDAKVSAQLANLRLFMRITAGSLRWSDAQAHHWHTARVVAYRLIVPA